MNLNLGTRIRSVFGAIWSLVVGLYRIVIVLSLASLIISLWVVSQGGPAKKVADNVALVLYPSGDLVEAFDQDPAQRVLEDLAGERPNQTLLRDLTDALDKAAVDPRIKLVVLRLDDMQHAGLAQLQELGAAVVRFRGSGKKVYAFAPEFDQASYLVAAQADHISLDPMGMVMIQGLGLYQNYFKEALDKLGIEINIFRIGEYKSAVEPFERNDMSPEARASNRAWLADLWGHYGRSIANGRGLQENGVQLYSEQLTAHIRAAGGDSAGVAKTAKLVDVIETLQDFRERIAQTVGWDPDHSSFRQILFSDYLQAVKREQAVQNGPAVALVVLQGEITDGESAKGVAGAETVTNLLTAARQDPAVAAVVLRVNSPGGSVTGSERIRRELKRLQAEHKPVVVSMSDLAASGGYWVSMDADEIWAHESTITGSIGIFALWPTFDKPLTKMGVHTDGVGTTPIAGIFRGDRPLAPEAADLIQSVIEHGYRTFVEGVSTGRDLPLEKVNDIARGRVWSGAAAIQHGLVDHAGGLNDAARAAARLAGVETDQYWLKEFRPQVKVKFLRSVLDFAGRALLRASAAQLGPAFEGALGAAMTPAATEALRALHWMNDPRGLYARCFCEPTLAD